jgi:glutamate formiminotransferase
MMTTAADRQSSEPPLIECVPNFSEGRRPEVIAAIVDAIASGRDSGELHVLNVSSDSDHNRTVVTFTGTPEAVLEAAFRGVQTAARLIDLNQHRGAHPRIGAADVVPFIPMRGASLDDCAALAHRLGRRISETLNLPVYYYESAAPIPERKNLAFVRRDPYERLRETIHTELDRLPDDGPAQLGPAGAVAVGARGPLIAFNVYLDTADVEVAVAIARMIRESSGGLPYLKALGLPVHGQAQVSMNVIDFRQTSLYAVMEAVRAEAARLGVGITHSEIVGLVPQSALVETALRYLQLPLSVRDLVLETQLGRQTGDYREVPFE